MSKPPGDAKPDWLSQVQRYMAALVALSGEAVKVVNSLRLLLPVAGYRVTCRMVAGVIRQVTRLPF